MSARPFGNTRQTRGSCSPMRCATAGATSRRHFSTGWPSALRVGAEDVSRAGPSREPRGVVWLQPEIGRTAWRMLTLLYACADGGILLTKLYACARETQIGISRSFRARPPDSRGVRASDALGGDSLGAGD